MAALGVDARGPKPIEYDVHGNELRLVELSHSPSSLMNLDVEEADLGQQLKNSFPKQFWTKYTATGQMRGYGTEPGYDALVFKSYIDRFWGVRSGRLFASSERATPWEKFFPEIAGDNTVSLRTTMGYGTYVSCNDGRFLVDNGGTHADVEKVTSLEQFYVYKTSACGKDWDTPPNGSDCIAFKNKETGYWLSADSTYLTSFAKALDP